MSTGPGPGRLLTLVVVAAGVLNLVCGFLPAYGHAYADATIPVLTTSGAYTPIVLLIGGLVAAGAFLPGAGRHDYLTAALSGAGAVGALATFLLGDPPLAVGAILLLIFAVVQALAAVGALLIGRPRSRTPGPVVLGVAGPLVPPSAPAPTGLGPVSAGPGPAGPGAWTAPAVPGPAPMALPAGWAPGPGHPSSVPSGAPGAHPAPPDAQGPRPGRPGAAPPELPDEDDPNATRIVRF